MNVTSALYRAAHGHARGMADLAGYLGISEHSLGHKVSPTYPGAHCSPDEVVTICEVTGDLGPLVAMAQRLGQMLMPLPSGGAAAQGDLARRLAEACREFGEFVSEISGDLADGRVTQTELRRIEREAGELIGVVHVLRAHAGALAEQGRPAAAGGGATPIGTGRRAA